MDQSISLFHTNPKEE